MKSQQMDIINEINSIYHDAECELKFSSNYELLVAVILSAQCTDKRVNIVTSELFKEYNTPEKMITLSQAELEQKIHACGFFHNKAKHILECSRDLVEKFGGEVPSDKEELKSLAGVGEKTANVVLATAFKIPAIAVDTHVFRVSNRLGIANASTVQRVQKQLEKRIPRELWSSSHYAFVLHGRYVCKSQRPNCEACKLAKMCKFYKTKNK